MMNVRASNGRISTRWLAIVGVLGVLLLGGALALPLLIDVNQYRGLIQSKAEEALGREVTLGPMSLSLLPTFGIKVKDLEVRNLVRARSLTVGVRLMPLLFGGSVDVKKIVLVHPEIIATRNADGRWSFEGIGGGGTGEGAREGATDAPRPGRPFSLARLLIKDGVVHLRDETRATGGPLVLDLGLDLDASVQGSGAGDLKSAFEGTLQGDRLTFDITGSLDREAPPGPTGFDIVVDRAEIDVARARELITSSGQAWPVPEGLLTSRSVKMSGRLQGSMTGGALSSLAMTDLNVQEAGIHLARDKKGKWNFEPLLGDGGTGGGAPGARPGTALSVKNLKLSGAKVSLHDEGVAGGAPVDLTLEDVQLNVAEFQSGHPIDARLSAGVKPGGGSLEISGRIPLASTGPIDATIDVEDLDARAISPYLKSLTNLSAASGAVSAHVKLSGTYPQKVQAEGSIELDEVETTTAQPIDAKADFAITGSDGFSQLQIGRFDLQFRRSRIGIRGAMTLGERATMVDLELPASSIDAVDLATLAALAGVTSPIEFSSTQPVKVQARIRGDMTHRQDLDLTGSLEVSDFSFKLPVMVKPMEQVRGRVTLRKNGFDVAGFSGAIGRSDIAGTISVSDLESPRATFALTSRRADFWELMSFLKQEPAGPAGPASPGGGAAGDDLLDKVAARGTLAIGEGSFDTLAFTDLESTVSLARKVLDLDPVSMKLYGGSMRGAAAMDMNRDPVVYTVDATTNGVDTDALLAANLQMPGMLAGTLSGRFSVTSSGGSRDAALRNARGSGDLTIENGKVGALNVLEVLSRASGLMGEKSLKEVSARLAKEGTEFSQLKAALEVGGGRIKSKALSMTSPDLELTDDGSLDLLAGTLHIAGQVVFSEALSQAMVQERSKVVDYFWDSKRERVNLPLTMSGPVGSPSPNIDWGTAGGKLARRKLEDTVRDRLKEAGLDGLLGGRGGKPPTEATPDALEPKPQGPASTASGELGITIEEKGFTGNPLLPDLKVRATVTGTGIAAAKARVTDETGRVVHEQSFTEKLSKYYTNHDRSAPAAITIRVELDGKRLIGVRGDLQVSLTATDAAGESVTKEIQVSR